MFKRIKHLSIYPFLVLIAVYQRWVSPLIGNRCRFYPSCSAYTKEALQHYGLMGVFYGIKRLLRCHPFAEGGHDPLPLPHKNKERK